MSHSYFLGPRAISAYRIQTRRQEILKCLLGALLVATAVSTQGTAEAAPSSVAIVQMATASPQVRHKGATNFVSLRVDSELYIGDLVRTGPKAKANLLFSDGSQVRLNSNASIEITAPVSVSGGRTSLFKAIAGEVWSRLRPNRAIQTPYAVAGVRGTEFDLNIVEGQGTTLSVLEGEVEFFNDFGSVTVEPAHQSIARVGAAPTKPITIANPGFIVEWTADLNRAVLSREKFFISLDRKVVDSELARRKTVLDNAPNNSNALRNYGDALFDSHRYADALVQYQNANQIEPQQPRTLARLGDTYLELGQLDEAEAAYRAAGGNTEGKGAAQVQTVALADETAKPDEATAPAQVGMAWLELSRERPAQAQAAAVAALDLIKQNEARTVALTQGDANDSSREADILDSEARIVLAVSLLRQNAQNQDAQNALQAVATGGPQRLRYQAHAWMAMASLARDDRDAALKDARTATEMAPQSSLAHGNLALVALYRGDNSLAGREAHLASELNPDSVAARVAYSQALLAQGDVDGASHNAAQAVALDPRLPEARYVLGVVDAQRLDYVHAERSLKEAVALSPDFLPAASALARVQTRMGKQQQAVALLTGMLPTHPHADAVQGALGEVYYDQGKYGLSASSYEDAAKRNPSSALYQAGLSRTLIDANRLNEAISAGQQAVAMAPNVGQYRAILGLAYEYSGLTAQAERQFREALVRDPQNALALAQLAYKHEGADLRPAAAGFAQGFLLNPAVSDQLVRGGVNLELTPRAGNQGQQNFDLTNRINANDGKLHSFALVNRNNDDGDRSNTDSKALDGAEHFTYVPNSKTNLYATIRGRRTSEGLGGSTATPDRDDEGSFKYGQAQIALRQRVGAGSYLWAGLFGNTSRSDIDNPQLNSFFDGNTLLPVSNQRFSSNAWQPEVRFDLTTNRASRRPGQITLGAAYVPTSFTSRRDLQFPINTSDAFARYKQENKSTLAYAQWNQRFTNRFSLVSQVRWQQLDRSSSALISLPTLNPVSQSSDSSKTRILPSLLATYQAGPRTSLRLSYNQRMTDVTTSTFAPVDTLLTTESAMLPYGTPDLMKLTQLDVEHSFGSGDFLKLFLFRTTANSVQIGGTDLLGFGSGLPAADAPLLSLSGWHGTGFGTRYERQLQRNLFASTEFVLRDVNSRLTAGSSSQRAPYEPSLFGTLGLNYIDRSGNKVGLRLRHVGSFYDDSPLQVVRSRFPAKTYVDLRLAREASLGSELFVSVTNLFDTKAIDFKDYPSAGRRFDFGVTRRF